jgi:hypothetical protein
MTKPCWRSSADDTPDGQDEGQSVLLIRRHRHASLNT